MTIFVTKRGSPPARIGVADRIAVAVLIRVLGIRHGGEARERVAGEERAVRGIIPASAEIHQAAGRAVAVQFAGEAERRGRQNLGC